MDGQIYGSYLTMMRIGTFKFAIYSAAYQELNRSTDYAWGEQSVFGGWDNLQFLGPGQDVQNLTGVIFPEFTGTSGTIDSLRDLALDGKPQLLLSGTGKLMGYWVITRIEEGQTKFAAFGVPRRQEFAISIRKYGDKAGQMGLLASLLNAVG
ncbi:phage tail protein [Acinetobacter gerneri]|uniref:phage tail protein n=1 Tax=Acinetobacter gerneri TaxID=202952 RepID=UPI003AF70A92